SYNMGSSNLSIGKQAFDNCNKLKDFSFTSGDNKSRISSIGQEAFRNCKALTNINLTSNNDLLQGKGIFSGCSGLKTVTVDISKYNSTKYNIPEATFSNCSKLENVTVINVGTIEKDAFKNCTMLNSFDSGKTNAINAMAFSGCSNLTDFTVGASLTNLSGPITDKPNPALRFSVNESNETFHATEDGDMIIKTSTTVVLGSGTDPVVPEGVTAIAQGAFQNHTGLVTIDLPASLTVIDGYAFYGCSNLREKIYRGGDWSNVNIGDHNDPIKNADLTVISREGDFAGNQLHWEFSDYEKELAITDNSSGCTVIPDFNNSTDRAPWYIWRPDIIKINGDFITEVGNYAFYGCRKLPSAYPGIKLGGVSSGTGGLTRIGKYAFGNCSSLTFFRGYDEDDLEGFKFASAGGTVEENAFSGCVKLEEIDTREVKVTLEAGSFNGCTSLKKVVIGKDTSFEAPLTDSTNSLEELHVDVNNGSYSGSDDDSFITSKNKKTLLLCTRDCTDIPDGIETIGTGAFYNLNSLQTVTIPSSVKKIEANAFFGCTGLEQINYLGNEDAWANIDISDTGNSILNKSNINFLATEGDIECEGGTLHWNIEDKPILGEITKTLVFTVKDGTVTSLNDFESALNVPWSASATRIQRVEGDFLTSVGAYAFCSFTRVTNDNFVLTSMKKAGSHAFENCDSLDKVINDSTITDIGDFSFSGCDGITTESGFTSSLKTMGAGAFAECGKLEEIHIPGSVTSIGTGVLKNCPKLEKIVVTDSERYKGNAEYQILLQVDEGAVTILAVVPTVSILDLSGTGITDIGESAFSGCTLLESITLPDDLESIGNNAFEGCENLESFTVPAGVDHIGSSVFKGCEKLTELKSDSEKFNAENNTLVETETKTLIAGCNGSTAIPDGVEAIGDGAFDGCSLIAATLTIPSSVKSIGAYAFSDCPAIKDTVDLSSISEVGDSAFENCENITKVTLPVITADSVFGISVFKGCISLESVTIPNGLTLIPESAFEDCFSLKRLDLPKSVTVIGKNALKSTSLETVNFAGTRSEWNRINIGSGNDELLSAAINTRPDESPAPPRRDDDYTVRYTVTYKPGFDGPEKITETKYKGALIALSPSLFTRDGFTLVGWKDEDGAVYAPDQSGIAVNSNMTFTAQWSSAVESPTKVISKPVTIKDSNGNEININMDIELTKAVSFNGLKHEWTDGKAGGKASTDITVKISGGIENYADIKKIKIKNNKNASADSSKKPAVIITLKPTGSDKAVKKSLNEINKTLKKDAELTFEIKPLDLTYMGDSLHGVPNGKKTKLKKLTADVPAGSSTKTVKLSKKDFSVDQIDAENGTATITGKGNCKGTVTIKF
ncbi:MAG: leucine-rich repeat protein, partial [Lachnospiraceae bacterium]|nr:leucine-rich repeat protein [Lachnospiraceae bacterium]